MSKQEVWLRGPVEGYAPLVMPVVHALLQVREDVEETAGQASERELWASPGGAASAGFHLAHLAGALDRLTTYARGEALSEAQRAFLKQEGVPGTPPRTAADLIALVQQTVDGALGQVQATPVESLTDVRRVGRAELPTTVLGLLFHAAEHSTRHVGQLITTLKIVRGLKLSA